MSQELLIWLGTALMVALPTRAVVRLRRRGRPDLAPAGRILLAAAAGALTVAALLGLDVWADSYLSAHMLQHVLIGDVVPLLLVLACRGPLRVHLLPARVLRPVRRLGLGRLLAAATRPLPAFTLWAASLAAWHVPALYDLALENARLHALEHASFLTGGLLVWSALLDPARRGLLPGWRAFGYAVALLAASGVLANVLVLSYRPLYPSYAGPGAVGDQDLAALVMMVEQIVTLGGYAALVARRQLRSAPAAPAPPHRHPLAA